MQALLALAVVVFAGTSWADRNDDAEQTLFEALRKDAAGDPNALEEFEALGAVSPPTRWSDDAYVHAARLAEQRGDLARARRNYERAIAIGGDARLAARARSELARLIKSTGGGRWDKVAVEHERLESAVYGGRNPELALRELEALIAAHPRYPRRVGVVLVIAEGWEREGHAARAIERLSNTRAADPDQQAQLDIALIHALIRHRDFDRAHQQLQRYRDSSSSDSAVVQVLESALGRGQRRRWWRRLGWGVICFAAAIAVIDLRRQAGSWRRALALSCRPPTEVLFLAPVVAVLALAAATGNALVAPAVWQILAGGVVVAWISGVILDVVRTAKGTIRLWRVVVHAAIAAATLIAMAYIALDQEALLDLISETAAHGPAMR